jgi:hypothetical protein
MMPRMNNFWETDWMAHIFKMKNVPPTIALILILILIILIQNKFDDIWYTCEKEGVAREKWCQSCGMKKKESHHPPPINDDDDDDEEEKSDDEWW